MKPISALSLKLILGLGVILCITACGRQKNGGLSARLGDEQTVKVERKDLEFSVEAIGDLLPSIQVDVKSEISGWVKKIHPAVGDTVERGDVIVELNDTDLLTEKSSTLIEIEGAKLHLNKTSLAAERAQQLVAADLISKQDADNLRLDSEIAKNSLDMTFKKLQAVEDKLRKTRIVAPIGGTVIILPIVEGQVVLGGPSVSAGTLLMTLADLSKMIISTHINQIDATRMKEGQSVQVTVDAIEDLSLNGKISFIAPAASIKNNIKGFSVNVLINRPDNQIRPGMSANVRIPISKASSVLSVPIESIFWEGNKRVAYLKEGERFTPREVKVGMITTDRAEIKSGLQEGDVISLVRPKHDEKG